jgi:hypothetical protein
MQARVCPDGVGCARVPRPGHESDKPSEKLDADGVVRRRRVKRTSRRRTPVYFHVPRNLDVRRRLPEHLKQYADCLNYWVHLMVTAYILWETDGEGYARLKEEYLRRVIPTHVLPELRMWAQQNRIMRWDRNYTIGEESMGYKLNEAYMVAGFHRIACTDERVADRVLALRRTHFYTDIKLDVHRHLRSSYQRLTVDTEAARDTVLSHPDLVRDTPIHIGVVEMIDAIADTPVDRLEFTYCTKGRVHTLVTRLATPLRQHLRVDGQPLVNADVVNSQPLLLGLLVLQYRKNGNRLRRVKDYTHHTPNPYTTHHTTTHTHPHTHPTNTTPTHPTPTNTLSIWRGEDSEADAYAEFTANRGALSADERRYVEICESGRIYEHMIERLAGVGFTVTRDEIKNEFYRLYYGRVRPVQTLRSEVSQAFARLFAAEFPGVLEVVKAVKRRVDYAYLACHMQNVESTLVINTICRRLMREYPHVPLITLHDSIATVPAYADLVRQVMVEEFARVGLRPIVKSEAWSVSETVRLSA